MMTTPCKYEGVCRKDCPRYLDDCDGNEELMEEEKMTEYEVVIDFESEYIIVEAETKEEAENKAYTEWLKREEIRPCWVGDCSEVEEDEN